MLLIEAAINNKDVAPIIMVFVVALVEKLVVVTEL